MASLKDIRKRISSVKNTRQITRAMKMVAAAKLRRAQEAILASRPYAYRIYSILLSLSQNAENAHPLLRRRVEKKIKLVVLAGDRGLCGSFNANILKAAYRFIESKKSEGVDVELDVIGKKANDFFKKRHPIAAYHEGILAKANFAKVSLIADAIAQAYVAEAIDGIYLAYNEFKSAIQQKVTIERLAPISTDIPEGVVGVKQLSGAEELRDYLFEPSKAGILNEIVPRHFRMQLFRAVLESVASEHGSRMSAMENATTNASDMIESLTLKFNKARQAAITTELMEIVGGVEAMR